MNPSEEHLTTDILQACLSDWFAPWVQALGLRVERFETDEVVLRLPQTDQLSRIGGMVCGQALMAAADTAMVTFRSQGNPAHTACPPTYGGEATF